MKLYIAGPMSGYPDFNYAMFHAHADRLERIGYEVLNPADTEADNPTPGVPQKWDWYMRHALGMVLQADGLAVLDDWGLSRGAQLEVAVANALQIPVLPILQWHTQAPTRLPAPDPISTKATALR